jgi:NAD dependent epimerase/dehydratase family enzyme
LAKVLDRPALLPMPGVMVRILFGEMGVELLLQGQEVIPAKLLQSRFKFEYPNLTGALQDLLK